MIEQLSQTQKNLLQNRSILLGSPIDKAEASKVIFLLNHLESINGENINLYINCPGGIISETAKILKEIEKSKVVISTICIGQASGSAINILASGKEGHRFGTEKCFSVISQFNREPIDKELQEILFVDELLIKHTKLDKNLLEKLRNEKANLNSQALIRFKVIDKIIKQ